MARRHFLRTGWGLVVIALGLATAAAARVAAQAVQPAPSEQSDSSTRVKATFLYHFGSYVTWPAAPGPGDPVTIAVLDAPDVAGELERLVAGRTIRGRPVEVRRLGTIGSLDADELLFIGPDDNGQLEELVRAVGNRPTLIVSDAPDGLAAGSMINFQVVDRRVRFEISLTRAREAGLMLSSRLLAAALRVETTHCSASALCRGGRARPARLVAARAPRRIAERRRRRRPGLLAEAGAPRH